MTDINRNSKNPSTIPANQSDDSTDQIEKDSQSKAIPVHQKVFLLPKKPISDLTVGSSSNKRSYQQVDKDCFDAVMTQYHEYVSRIAQAFCRRTAISHEDLTNATFERFYKYIRDYVDREDKYPKAYLHTICKTIFFNWLAEGGGKYKRTDSIEDHLHLQDQTDDTNKDFKEKKNKSYFDFPSPHYLDYIKDQITHPKLKRILLSIQDNYLRPFADHRFGDLKYEEIAQRLNMKMNTLMGSIKRAADELSFRMRHPIEVPENYYGLPLKVAQKKLVKLGAFYYIEGLINDEFQANKPESKEEQDNLKASIQEKYTEYYKIDPLALFIYFAIKQQLTTEHIIHILNAQSPALVLSIGQNQSKEISLWTRDIVTAVYLYVEKSLQK
jgi:RNA polymerase sigma factor (sigma-70 family)